MDLASPDDTTAKLEATRERIASLEAEIAALRNRRDIRSETQNAIRQLRNTLAIMRSVFQRTADTAETLEDMSLHFIGRFDALARSGSSGLGGHSVEVEDLVRDELLRVHESDGPRTTIAGPTYPLSRQQAPLVGLAIHELATNSIKFGALATEGATLSVTWTPDDADGALHLDWIEAGVPIVAAAPLRVGFGRQFIEQALPYQLEARTSFELQPGGLACRITLLPSPPEGDLAEGSPT